MAQPKNFGFGIEENMLKTESRKFFKNNSDDLKLMALVGQNPDPHREPECHWDKNAWKKMGELGWASLAVPEKADGAGMSSVGVAAIVEEAGRAAFPSPLLTTINTSCVLSHCETEEAVYFLRKIAEGKGASLAIMDQNGSWKATENDMTINESMMLTGTAWFVQDAQKVDYFIVKATFKKGEGLVVIPKDAKGIEIIPDAIVDLTRDQAHIEFKNAEIKPEWIISPPGTADDVISKSEPSIFTMIAADMCGAADWQLQTTVEFAKTRVQFGRPIGFFQAVKHPIVDMMLKIDEAKSLVYNAACAIDHEPQESVRYSHMAKSAASDMATFCSDRSVQLHGGMGFTWESFIHLYFKRQLHHRSLFGDGRYHRAVLAEIMF